MSLTLLKNKNLVMKKSNSIIIESFATGGQGEMKKMSEDKYYPLEQSYLELAKEYNNLLDFLADCYPEVLKEWEGEN